MRIHPPSSKPGKLFVFFQILFIAVCFTSCGPKPHTGPYFHITLEIDTAACFRKAKGENKAKVIDQYLSQVSLILEKRLEHLDIDKDRYEVKPDNGRISVKFWNEKEEPVKKEKIFKLLQANAEISLNETYILDEIGNKIFSGDSIDQAFLKRFHPGRRGPKSPVILVAESRDTAAINKWMSSKNLPADFKPAWTVKPVQGNNGMYYELVALKIPKTSEGIYNPPLKGDIFESAEVKLSETGVVVSCMMHDAAAGIFKNLTNKNLNRPIAVCIDGMVYSYPVVASEIANGRCDISGNLSKAEAESLAAALKAGSLPVNVRIVEYNMSGNAK